MSRIKAYRRVVDRSFPGPVVDYFYLTKVDGRDWAADIKDESAEGWGEEFKWDDNPCGMSLHPDEIEDLLADADEIGYIENGKLHITKRWRVPTAYGYNASYEPVVTNWRVVGKGIDIDDE